MTEADTTNPLLDDLKLGMKKAEEAMNNAKFNRFDEATKDRAKKSLLVGLYHIESLIDLGVLIGPKTLSETGRKEAKALIDEGFECTEDEMFTIINFLMKR